MGGEFGPEILVSYRMREIIAGNLLLSPVLTVCYSSVFCLLLLYAKNGIKPCGIRGSCYRSMNLSLFFSCYQIKRDPGFSGIIRVHRCGLDSLHVSEPEHSPAGSSDAKDQRTTQPGIIVLYSE